MAREVKSKHDDKQTYVAEVIMPTNAHHTESRKEPGKRAWSTDILKPSVGKKSGSGRRIHSARDNLRG
jgi:hypothetical protein